MQLNYKTVAQLVLSVAGICSLSLPFTQTAQAGEVRSLCGQYDSTFVAVETKNFLVSICGGDTPHNYVGLDKKTGRKISLPLTVNGTKNRGRYFEAVNGEYTYGVTVSNTNKNLTVKRNNRTILREAIVRGF